MGMLILLSPTKTLKIEDCSIGSMTAPAFPEKTAELVRLLQQFSVEELMELMKVSRNLAELNHERYQFWEASKRPVEKAFLAFRGEVFNGIQAWNMSDVAWERAQASVRILSGLYGVVKPLDKIQAYRFEMGTKIQIGACKNLYEYWGSLIAEELRKTLGGTERPIVNLASMEYFKAAKTHLLPNRVVTPVFKQNKNGVYKVLTIYAKRARGLMTRFIIEHGIEDVELLKAFDLEGYYYQSALSSTDEWVFTRDVGA